MSARLPDEFIARMHADYEAGMSLRAVARKYGRERRTVAENFKSRGLAVRPLPYALPPRHANGQIIKAPPFTEAQIDALIRASKKIRVPKVLKREWRTWSMERRATFACRLRQHLALATGAPSTPFSSNVDAFAYGSPRAHAIADRMNAGLNSRYAKVKIDLCSEGVIYQDKLFFWASRADGSWGDYYIGPWTKEGGRPALTRVVWEEAHGRATPEGHVVRHADGNRNNFEPENLVLATRNDLARQNQASFLNRRSRELTTALLNRNQRPHKDHDDLDTLSHLALHR